MTDHHDFGDHHYDDPLPYEQQHDDAPLLPDPEPELPWEHDFAAPEADLHHDELPEVAAAVDESGPTALVDVPDLSDWAEDVFPPAVDVGELPEPVDGFPWIDTGSLGLADIATARHASHPGVDPAELAEYAATDVPPGADPWAALADSDDPATSTLARFWAPGT